MSAPSWIRKLLAQRGVPFEESHHEAAYTAQELAERAHTSGHHVAKVVIALADDRPVELVLPASRHVVLSRVQAILHARNVRLATEQEVVGAFKDCEPGAVPPLRHWKQVPVLMDKSLATDAPILFAAGTHEDAVRLKFADWFNLVRPKVARFAALSRPEPPAQAGAGPAPDADAELVRHALCDLVDVLHTQAKEIQRLSTHVERHTNSLLTPTQMPLVVSELAELHARLLR
jgi:Ala-tRNA(Pro) deacylase